MRVSGALVLVASLALVSTARADLTEEGKRVEDELFKLTSDTDYMRTEGSGAYGLLNEPAVDCAALIARGKKVGIAPGDKLRGSPTPYLFKRAPELCAEYTKWRLLVEAAVLFREAQNDHQIVLSMKAGEVTAAWAMDYDAKGEACHARVEKLIARGLATDVPVLVNREIATVATLRVEYCQGLIDWAKQFAIATEMVRDAAAATMRDKYARLGAKGDRLAYLIEADLRTLYGKGCTELDRKGRVTSPVLYEVWEDDAQWSVWKTTFRKERKVKSNVKKFSKRLVSDWRCW